MLFISLGVNAEQVLAKKSRSSILPKKHKKVVDDKSLAEKNNILFAYGNERKLEQSHLNGIILCCE